MYPHYSNVTITTQYYSLSFMNSVIVFKDKLRSLLSSLQFSFQEASVFVFDKKIADKLHKPRRREAVAEILRREVKYLERFKHPKCLQIWHPLEECQ